MNDTINILSLVSYPFLPPRMGGQKGIALFNEYLGQKISLHCICTRANDTSFAKSYTISNSIGNSKFRYINPAYFFMLRRIIRSKQITHLILEHPYYGWLGLLLKWFCGIRLIVHSHNIESTRFKSMGKWWWGILWHYEKAVHFRANHNFFIQEVDRLYAIKHFKLNEEKCTVITYGIEMEQAATAEDRSIARQSLCSAWNIDPAERILLFNGTLDYKPNRDALDCILDVINPLLMKSGDFRYKIIICGNKLPVSYDQLKNYKTKNIIYAGFVEDVNLYFKGADIFINPVTDGGGIKTKLVEALGFNTSVVSTKSGATGIPLSTTGEKLKLMEDDDHIGFVNAIITTDPGKTIPPAFFSHFFWGSIASQATECIRRMA